jgi:predicted ArsR family transcriptional regulator
MAAKKFNPQTKSAIVIALLNRGKGASIDEISKTTTWQSHSVRAFLTGLRKKGYVITREQRGDDGTAYRITQTPDQNTEAEAS